MEQRLRKPILTLSALTIGLFLLAGSAAAQSAAQDVPFSVKPFPDVSTKHPSYTAIEYLRTNNIIKGYVDGTFKPGNRIRRSEFVYLLTNPFFLDQNEDNTCIQSSAAAESETVFFTDVFREYWYAPAVCVAKTNQIIDGYPDNTFRGAEFITFVEAAKIMSNVFVGLDTQDTDPTGWYKTYVQWLSDMKAIPTSVKRLDQLMTRADTAEMLWRIKTENKTKASVSYGTLVK